MRTSFASECVWCQRMFATKYICSIHTQFEVSHIYTCIGFLHARPSSTLTKKMRREPSVENSGDIYNWSLSSLSSWASQLPPQLQNWLNCPNTTKSSFNQTNNGIKNGHTLFSVFAIFNIPLWILIRRRIGGGGLSALPEKERGRQSWALSELRDRRLSKFKCQSWALSGASPGRSCLARLLQPPSEGLGSPPN